MLGEAHGHIIMDGINYKSAIELHKNEINITNLRTKLKSYQDAGINFFRDGGDHLGVSLAAKALAQEYNIDYLTPVFAIFKKGLYGSIVGRSFDSISAFRSLVNEVKAKNGDFIKIMLSGIMDFNCYGKLSCEPLDNATTKELVNISHGEGFSVMAHANGDAVYTAIECGVDSIEHCYYVENSCAKLLASENIICVPTISAVVNLLNCNRFQHEIIEKIHAEHMNFLRQCVSDNVMLGCGSDAGAYLVSHPDGVIAELGYLDAVGCSRQQLLATQEKLKQLFQRN